MCWCSTHYNTSRIRPISMSSKPSRRHKRSALNRRYLHTSRTHCPTPRPIAVCPKECAWPLMASALSLRKNSQAVDFVRSFVSAGKPIAAICHGPWTLIEAGAVKGREVTSYDSIKTDLKNAGAKWVDREVVVDNGLVTSRKPDDIPAFNEEVIELFAAGGQRAQKAAG